MTLAQEYRRQAAWRKPEALLAALPLSGRLVLDLGCGIGVQAAALAARGARVVGVDLNEELLVEARAHASPGTEFQQHDLRDPPDLGITVDGVWCSFVAAYFPDLPPALHRFTQNLGSGGWIALVEVDDLFAHEPLPAETRALFETYARVAFEKGYYDFYMGRKLAGHVRAAGFDVDRELELPDEELAFDGSARPEVLEAWRERLARLGLLRALAGDRFDHVCADFLDCLAHPRHRSGARVHAVIARR